LHVAASSPAAAEQQPSPQKGGQSAEQLQLFSAPVHIPSPQQMPGHSEGQLHASSVPEQQPSPHRGAQSNGQLQSVSLPVQQLSKQTGGQSPPGLGQLRAVSWVPQLPLPQAPPAQSALQPPESSDPVQQPSPQSGVQSAGQLLAVSGDWQVPSPHD
jgi:hypothetical protein